MYMYIHNSPVLHYITYKFITRPTCQFASESGAWSRELSTV